jgi:hypothetical protein
MDEAITGFLEEYSQVATTDKVKARQLIKDAYNGNEQSYQKELEDRWYSSLLTDSPDYSVYNHEYYFTDVFYCWWKYSRKYIKSLAKLALTPTSVADVGNGIGYSTRQLKEIYPNARVIGTNMKDTLQYEFNDRYAKDHGYEMTDDLASLGSCDLIFASEFLEHIQSPCEWIDTAIKLNPTYLVLANSFNTHSVGHFTSYLIDGVLTEQSKVSRIINNYLRNNGYSQIKTGFWNNKPTVWKRD